MNETSIVIIDLLQQAVMNGLYHRQRSWRSETKQGSRSSYELNDSLYLCIM